MLDAARGPDAPPTGARPQAPFARADGEARVGVRLRDGLSRLRDLRQRGAARCLLPRVDGPPQAVLLNTAGGLTGGDRMSWRAEADAGAALTVATQTAERVYRALPGTRARVETRLSLGPGARLDWLPQETILFDGAALTRTLEIDMAEDATLLAVEPLILGRAAMGETVREASLRDAWRLRRGGRLVRADALRLEGPVHATAARRATLGGALAAASLLYAAPDAEARLGPVREILAPFPLGAGAEAGASLRDGVLAVRVVARDGRALRAVLIPLLLHLRGAPLPRVWTM